MSYRDEARALEARVAALEEEIDDLLDRIEEAEGQASVRRLAHREATCPPVFRYHRPSWRDFAIWFYMLGGFAAFFGFVGLVANNPVEERIGAMIGALIFIGVMAGFGLLIVHLNRRGTADLVFDATGLRVGADHLPWDDIDRIRVEVGAAVGKAGSTSREVFLHVRRAGVWHQHRLHILSAAERTDLFRWTDWLRGATDAA